MKFKSRSQCTIFIRLGALTALGLLLFTGVNRAETPQTLKTSVSASPPAKKKTAKPAASQPLSPLQKAMNDLKSQDVALRRAAADELGILRDPHASPALILALSDADAVVRGNAARALGFMKTTDATKELSRVMKDDPEASVRQSAAIALSFIADPSSVDALIAALKDPSDGVRFGACQALANVRSPKAVPALQEVLKSNNLPFRRLAISALGDIGDPSAAPSLRPFLKEKDGTLVSAAVASLGKLKDMESIPALKKLLSDKTQAEIRVAAAKALWQISEDKSGRDALLDVLKDPQQEQRLRYAAAQTVAEFGDASLVGPLRKIYEAEAAGAVKSILGTTIERLAPPKK